MPIDRLTSAVPYSSTGMPDSSTRATSSRKSVRQASTQAFVAHADAWAATWVPATVRPAGSRSASLMRCLAI
jgi:hypothetical protein